MAPSDRKKLLESYKSAYDRMVKTLEPIPKEARLYKPSPSSWSIHEILVHLADSEAHMYIRARRFIAEPESKVLGFDNDLWAARLSYHEQDAAAALELFKYLRQLTYDLVKQIPEKTWQNTVEHSEFGVMTMDQWLERADKHANDHISQIKENYQDWLRRR